ncbi:MAG: PD40 domain-containing protein [Chlorobi bacterium]|nr:PD40 domain-containing protein [Chlorobiota bacterium]
MNNREDILNRYLDQACQQPPLLSRDEAETILLQRGVATEPNGRSSQGIVSTLLVGVGVMALFLLLPGDTKIAEAPELTSSLPVLAEAVNVKGENRNSNTPKPTLSQSPLTTQSLENNSEEEDVDRPDNNSVPQPTDVENRPPSVTPQHITTSPSLTQGTLSNSSANEEVQPEQLSANAPKVNLGYLQATPRLQPLPETGMVPEKLMVAKLTAVNSYSNDYNPMVTADGRTLYFVSDREHGLGGHDFWVATKEERHDLDFTVPSNLGSSINTPRNEGGATISADGQRMYFTACNRPDGLGECDIYEAHLGDAAWEEIRNIHEINSGYWETQPAISSDGRTLYFVSNRPGATGGYEDTDIYISNKQADGTWSRPKNLGEPINTAKREDSPFIVPGGNALYFSSEGHPGYGGLDFFISHKKDNQTWGRPVNLGNEFNTPDDERFIAVPAAEDVIYFAKSGNDGKLDLYMARKQTRSTSVIITGNVQKAETNSTHYADLLFVDAHTGEIIQYARTSDKTEGFSLVLGKNTSQRTIDIFGYTDSFGEFRTRITLGPSDSYREYRCDLIVSTADKQIATLSTSVPRLSISTIGPRELIIKAPEQKGGELVVFDAWGNRLVQETFLPGEEQRIHLDSAPEGIYLARLGDHSGVISLQKQNK